MVTGGSSGLGLGIVKHFSRNGAKVVLADLPISKGAEVAKELGDNVVFAPVDVTSEADVLAAIEIARNRFGRLDLTVNCAGISVYIKAFNFNTKVAHKLEDFTKVLMVNTVGTFNVIRLSAGLMGENEPNQDGQRGVIVNTGSIAAFDGQKGQAAYAASKAAVAGMTLPLARELGEQGIRVCTLAPGLFNTPMLQAVNDKDRLILAKSIPFPQRFGHPEEYAQFVQAIYENTIMNGEVIRIDGGLRMRH